MNSRPRFTGAGVLVTGASRGLGRAVAKAFAAEGGRVGVAYRTRREEAEETLELVTSVGGDGGIYELDVREPESVERAVRAFEEGGPIHVLVNNAAVVNDQAFAVMEGKTWASVISTNLTGTYHCCRAVVPSMMARGGGAIVNVVSIAGKRASPGQTNYAASKGGVMGLTTTLASELARHGIRVNAVMPGLLSTGMGARLDHRVAERRRSEVPLGRFGEGEEVANVILFLASDDASYVLGQVLTVDGGLSL